MTDICGLENFKQIYHFFFLFFFKKKKNSASSYYIVSGINDFNSEECRSEDNIVNILGSTLLVIRVGFGLMTPFWVPY
jgi:hypothetical protein